MAASHLLKEHQFRGPLTADHKWPENFQGFNSQIRSLNLLRFYSNHSNIEAKFGWTASGKLVDLLRTNRLQLQALGFRRNHSELEQLRTVILTKYQNRNSFQPMK